jgi:hypothetical protein
MSSATSSGQLTPARHPHGGLGAFARMAPTSLAMGRHFGLRDARTQALQGAEAMKGAGPAIFKDFSF